ncbi:hypothetical protein C8Q75DRAFT_733073 [Abortiporus biennis]|nr:hypothetical protein C8Q75DRAFT_733073 [Abortiporus biennis]
MENSLISAADAGSQTDDLRNLPRRRIAPLPRRTDAYHLRIIKLRQHLRLPFELLIVICCYLDAKCLHAFSLASRMFADASLIYRFYSVTIFSQLRAERFFAMQNFSTRIAPMIQHARISMELFQPPRFSRGLERDKAFEDQQEFLIWIFTNVLNKFNNLSGLSFVGVILDDSNPASSTSSKLQAFASLPSLPGIKFVTLENCEFSSTSYNLLFSQLTQIRSLAVDDVGVLKSDRHPLISLPDLTQLTIERTDGVRSQQFTELDVFIDIPKVKKLKIKLSYRLDFFIIDNSESIGDKLQEATSVEELELDIGARENYVDMCLFYITFYPLRNLRILKLGQLLNYSRTCSLFNTITSPNLQRVEGECDYTCRSAESLISTLKKLDEAIFKTCVEGDELG